MKRLFALLLVLGCLLGVDRAAAAPRYWVSAVAANWDATAGTKWSATSGGAGGAAVPTATDDVHFDGASPSNCTVNASSVCNNLDFTGYTHTFAGSQPIALSASLTMAATMTRTYTGQLTFNSTAAGNTVTSNGVALGSVIIFAGAGGAWSLADALTTSQTVNVNQGSFSSAAKALTCLGFNSTGALTRAITLDGTTITLTGLNAVNMVAGGLTFSNDTSTLFTFTYSGATARTFAAGGNAINDVSVTAGTGDFLFTGTRRNMDFTGFAGRWRGSVDTFKGNLILASGMTVESTTGNTTFAGTSGTQTITSHGVSLDRMLVFDGVGGTFQLQDALLQASNRQLQLKNGTFDANNQNVTTGIVNTNNTGTRVLNMGSGAWTVTGFDVNNDAWVANLTNLTLNPSTSTIVLTEGSASEKHFRGGGGTYNALSLGGSGSGAFVVSGNNTFANLGVQTPPHTVKFAAGSVQTVSATSLGGTAGNVNVLSSDTPGTQATLTKSANDVAEDYLTTQDLMWTGGARWFLGKHSSDVGNSNGARFTGPYRSPVRPLARDPAQPLWPVVVLDIGGQSNALGRGVYVGVYPGDSRITYWVNGVEYPFGPLPATNFMGLELTSAPAIADALGMRVVVSKGALSGSLASSWVPATGVNWPTQVTAINLSSRYNSLGRNIHFIWMQGESNADGTELSTFKSDTQAVIAGVRAAYAPQPVWLHMCQINSHIGGSANAAIAAIEAQIVSEDPASSLLNFDDVVPVLVHYTDTQFETVIGPRVAADVLAHL